MKKERFYPMTRRTPEPEAATAAEAKAKAALPEPLRTDALRLAFQAIDEMFPTYSAIVYMSELPEEAIALVEAVPTSPVTVETMRAAMEAVIVDKFLSPKARKAIMEGIIRAESKASFAPNGGGSRAS